MLSSTQKKSDTQNKTFQHYHHHQPQISPTSSSSSSCTFQFSPTNSPRLAPPRTMEEVWRDINLHTPRNSTSFRSTFLQDFLARPFAGTKSPPPPPIPPQLPNLNSQPMMPSDASFPPMDVSISGFFHNPFANEMCFSNTGFDCSAGGDPRHKRMIKNRESAARSRARKQAYTSELEREVAQLMEENAKLRSEHEQLRLAAASQHPKKQRPMLQRTSTAPF